MIESAEQRYMSEEYFAFVEPFDSIPDPSYELFVQDFMEPVTRQRREYGLAAPSVLLWLDCIRAQYSIQLGGIDESVTTHDRDSRQRRRRRISAMDPQSSRTSGAE